MIDPDACAHLGEYFYDALVTYKSELCFIEARRDVEASRWTYAQALRRSGCLARRLASAGVGPGDRVAVLMSNQPAWLLTAIAVYWRGGVLVPIDPKLAAREQAELLRHARPRLLVAEHALWRELPAEARRAAWVVGAPDGEALADGERWERDADPEAELPGVEARSREDLAAIVYSSGTVSEPRGCRLTHGNYLSQWAMLSRLYALAPSERWFSVLPTNHAIDFMCGLIGPLGCGATVVHQRVLRPEYLRWTMHHYGITAMAVVPMLLAAFRRMVEERVAAEPPWKRELFAWATSLNAALTRRVPRPAVSRRLLRDVHAAFGGRLRHLFCGGAWVHPEDARFFYRLGIPVVIGYGLTEACTVVTVNDLAPFRADTVGAPLPGVDLKVADPDEDGVGEVLVRGPTVMAGYLERPDLEQEAFTADGWLRTGDLGALDAAGHLRLVGRSKNIIVTAGGKNVHPEEVERDLGAVPCEELAVFAASFLFPGRGMGGDAEQLIAVVRAKDGPGEELAEPLRRASHRLPAAKRLFGFVPWTRPFPRTASLKIKRALLAEQVRDSGARATALADRGGGRDLGAAGDARAVP